MTDSVFDENERFLAGLAWRRVVWDSIRGSGRRSMCVASPGKPE